MVPASGYARNVGLYSAELPAGAEATPFFLCTVCQGNGVKFSLSRRIGMTGQLSIHHREHSYSDRWTAYCDMHSIPYRAVNCLDSGIMKQLASSAGLLWHWDQADPREQVAARHVIKAAEAMGVAVFPNTSTCWHFDDKIAQKY